MRKHTQAVAERIARLNPNGVPEGCIPRGWHPARTTRGLRFMLDLMPKGEFIRRYGRRMWNIVPRESIWKDGRRAFVTGIYVAQNCRG